jgi:hypothetical protein
MTRDQIIKHSIQAYNQWKHQWRAHAIEHKSIPTRRFEDFRNHGLGKAALLVANGYSFEENIETIKKYKDNVDVICCDKTLGHLLDNGITPFICITCDANINYEKYLEPWKDKLKDIILFQNVCGNPQWTKQQWKSVYLYVNKDVMSYEKEFADLSGHDNFVIAGTNVSNMMVVLLTQADTELRQNLFHYDKMILIGFDYSWKMTGKYYAFDQTGNGKHNFMRHVYGLSLDGNLIFTSNNLSASASWLNTYVSAYKFPVVQCSRDTLRPFGLIRNLEKNMQYRHKTSDREIVKYKVTRKLEIELELKKLNNDISAIEREHWLSNLATL